MLIIVVFKETALSTTTTTSDVAIRTQNRHYGDFR